MAEISATVRPAGKVPVGADIHAPETVEITLTGVEGLTVDAFLRLIGRRYVVQRLEITGQEYETSITSELIRKIPVQKLVRRAMADGVDLWTPIPSQEGTISYAVTKGVTLAPQDRDRLVAAGPTDETLLWVARVYIMGELAGDPPAKAVREVFGIPTSTAGYWIRRAKDRGLL